MEQALSMARARLVALPVNLRQKPRPVPHVRRGERRIQNRRRPIPKPNRRCEGAARERVVPEKAAVGNQLHPIRTERNRAVGPTVEIIPAEVVTMATLVFKTLQFQDLSKGLDR